MQSRIPTPTSALSHLQVLTKRGAVALLYRKLHLIARVVEQLKRQDFTKFARRATSSLI